VKYIILIFSLWFIGGLISLLILRRFKLPPIYRFLLFIEGLIGLIFVLIFKGTIDEKRNEK